MLPSRNVRRSSHWLPPSATGYAISEPSGDQAASVSLKFASPGPILRAPPASAGMTKNPPPSRFDRNTICRPSGDQRDNTSSPE